jgi:acetylornithine/N-succinyldiaminopimelate aminotransferase
MKAHTTEEHYFPGQYTKELLLLDRGSGVYLEDCSGNRYLDFGSGIAVNALGYGREDLANIACEQMKKIIHVSNLYATEPAIELSAKLAATGNFAAVHFGNSGSEANESAIKYARLYASRTFGAEKHKIACFTGAFHGRTLGALSCTPTPKYQEPYGPLVPGVEVFPYNDAEAVRNGLSADFAAVIVEVIQGEGGLDTMQPEFAAALKKACCDNDIILIADEVQTGCGRTGEFYASSWAGLEPDIITLSKPLAGGLPLSATLIPQNINSLLTIGDHGTTFGGGPVTTAVANYVVDQIFNPSFLDSVKQKGEYLTRRLTELVSRHSMLAGIKGKGLLQGIAVDPELAEEELKALTGKVLTEARGSGLLVLRSGAGVIRIAPPLIISEEEIDKGAGILDKVFSTISNKE